MNVEEIAVYDIYGRLAMSQQVGKSASQQVVDVAKLNRGIYFVNIKTDNGEIIRKVVKN